MQVSHVSCAYHTYCARIIERVLVSRIGAYRTYRARITRIVHVSYVSCAYRVSVRIVRIERIAYRDTLAYLAAYRAYHDTRAYRCAVSDVSDVSRIAYQTIKFGSRTSSFSDSDRQLTKSSKQFRKVNIAEAQPLLQLTACTEMNWMSCWIVSKGNICSTTFDELLNFRTHRLVICRFYW